MEAQKTKKKALALKKELEDKYVSDLKREHLKQVMIR